MRPGESDNVFLKLEDGQECVPPGSVDTELGTGQNVAVLRLDPIVCRQSQPSRLQQVDDPPGRPEGRQKAGNHDVGVHDPDRRVIHAGFSACAPASPP